VAAATGDCTAMIKSATCACKLFWSADRGKCTLTFCVCASLSVSFSLTHTHSHTHIPAHTHARTHAHIHTQHTHNTHTHIQHTHTHTRTHTHTHTHTFSQCLYLSMVLVLLVYCTTFLSLFFLNTTFFFSLNLATARLVYNPVSYPSACVTVIANSPRNCSLCAIVHV
jgi:hypothetical protein